MFIIGADCLLYLTLKASMATDEIVIIVLDEIDRPIDSRLWLNFTRDLATITVSIIQ